jgi:mono/diheme cytochrome c family protein
MFSDARFGAPGRRFGGRTPTFRALLTLAACLILVLALVQRSTAQSPAARSTMAGVYSAAQAGRGEETYMSICVACHPAGTYSTPAFKSTWVGRPLSDLFSLVSTTMPKIDPGGLTPQEYAQVIAYILKLNGVPAGKTDLPADAERLKRIRIEMPGSRLEKK